MTAPDPQVVPILMYHSIADDAHALDLPFTIAPRAAEEHLAALHDWGARTLTVTDYARALRDGGPLPPRTIVITVDDAYADTEDTFLPMLASAGFSATVFVTTSYVGTHVRGSRMVSWPQVRAMRAAGLEIGAHSHHHVALDLLDPSVARREMVQSIRELEQHLGDAVTSFAYPYGYYTRRLRDIAEGLQLQAACAARNSLSHPADDRFALSRLVVRRGMGAADVIDLVDARASRVRSGERVAQRLAWRTLRRVAGVRGDVPRDLTSARPGGRRAIIERPAPP